MNKIRKTLVVVFSALFVLCMAVFAAGCTLNLNNSKAPVDAETPDTSKNAYTVSVDVNDPSLGYYTLSEKNCGDGYEEGSLVTFTVKPNEDYEARLSINGEEVELQGDSYTFAVSEDVQASVEYIYKYEIYTYVLEGEGTIGLSDRHEDGKFHAGDNVTVTVTPSAGYELNEVLINGEPKEMTPSEEGGFTYTIENLSGRTYVVAKFGALHTVTLAQENEIDNEGVKGEVTLAAGETPIVSGETLLSEGTEVTLTVKPKEGETFSVYVDGYYQIPADGGNGTKTVTFTVKADTVVKVVWDVYYTVSIEGDDKAEVKVYLQNYTTDQRRFLAGTEIDFTVIADAGYEVDSVMVGDQLLTPVSGIYTLTVNDNVIIEVKLKSHGCNVSVSLSNSSYGEAGLSIIEGSSNEDGTYAYDSKLTLTATPNAGYKLNYVTVNGTRVKMTGPDDDGAYTCEVTVTADTKIYVAFGKTERYNVRVSFYSLTALAIDPELNGNKKALPNDVYITASCYEGQEYTFDLNLDESNAFSEGVTLYYSLDGAEPVLWEKSESGYVLEGKVGTENISYILTCELPALKAPDLSVEAGSMVGSDRIDAADYVEAQIRNGEYVYTFLADPSPELCPFTTVTASYEFKGWIVTVDNKQLTEPAVAAIAALADDPEPYLFHEGDMFNLPYAEGKTVTIKAVWEQVGYVLKLTVNNLPEGMKINIATFTYDEAEDKMTHIQDILQISKSDEYTVKISSIEYYFQVEMEQKDLKRITLYDPWYDNGEGGHDFYYDGLGSTLGSEQSPDIWTNGERVLTYLACTDEVGDEFTITVTYTQLYDVFVNGEKQSEPLADGEDFTLPAAVGEAPKAVDFGAWEYHWYKEGSDDRTYYVPEHVLEAVHGELRLIGEWVVPVTYTVQYEVKGGPAPDDKPAEGTFFKVYARGLELNVGDNTVYYINAEKQETLSYAFNIPEGWRAVVEYWRTDNSGEFNDLSVRERYYDSNDSEQGRPTYSKAKVLLKVTYLKIYDLTITGDENVTVAYGENQKMDFGYDAGSVVDLTITAKTGYLNVQVSANIPEYLTHDEGTDVWHVTLNADITLTITAEKQPVSFPDPDEGTEETSGAPVQGEWQSASEESPSTLSFTEDSVTVNGEEVERIGYEGEGGEIVYTLETETKTYTLEWYGKVAGYILALTDTTTSGASPVALFAAEAPANVTYFVSPAYGERYCDAFKGGDAAKLVGEWTAEGQILTFSELEGQAQVSLDGNSAKYLFAVAEGHYLMVIGTTAYDMILEGYVLNVNGVAFHTQYQVTVTEDGDKADGCSYTLKNVDADVGSDGKVAAGTVLTLTVNAPKGYTVSVVITGGSYETQDNTYTITVSTGVTIAITYTAPSVDTVTGAALGSAALVLDIDTTGYAEDDTLLLQSILKLRLGEKEIAPAEVTFASEGKFKATFSLSGVEAGSYAVTLTADGKAVSFNDGLNANAVEDKTTYDFKKDGDAYQLTVTVKVEYTVTVNETPADGCSYELKKGDDRLELLDNKATVEENTVLTLTVNAPKGYTVSVTITGGSYETQGNTYTITVSGDVTIAITYTAPDPARITAFGLLNMLKDGADIQLVLRFNATNYLDSQENVKADLTLYVGEKTFTAYQVDIQTDIYTVFFHIDPAQLSMAAGSSVDLKLYSEVIGQEYTEIATSVSPDQNSATFNDADIYSVKLENGKVSLQAEKVKYTVTVNETPSDKCSYELKNGDVTISSGDKVEAGTKLTLKLNLTEGYTAEVKVSGGSETHEGNTYTITVSANTEITITYTAPVVEKKVTGFAGSTLVVDGTGTKLQLVLNLKVEGYTVDEIKEKATVTVNGKTYRVDVTGAMSGTGDIAVHFLLTPETDSVLDFEDGSYKIVLHLNGDYDYPTAGAAPDASKDFDQTNISLKTENDELLLVVATKTTPVEKRIYGFENSNIVNHDTHFSIYLRFVVEGFESVDAFCSAAKLYIGDDVVINATHVDGGAVYVVQFLISADNIPSLVTGKHVLKLVVDGIEGEIRKPASRDDGATAKINNRTYALLLEGDDLYLNITEEKTSFNVTVEEKPEEAKGTYTLKKDNVDLGEGKITKDDVLTLEITALPEGYTKATVSVKGATLEGENSSYTIKNATADVVITITYTKEGEEQVREIVAIEGDGKTHFYGEQWFEIHISKDDSDFLKEYDSTLRGRVNGGNAIGFQVKNYDACFFQINVGEDNYEKSFELEWLDGDKVIAVTHYVCTIPEYHHVELTVENDGDGNTATLNPDAGDIKRNTQVVLTITVKEGWTVGVLVNKVAITLSDQDNGTKTYSFKLTDNTVISVTFIDASKPVQVKDLPAASELSAADTYGNNFFNLKLAGDGLTWLTNEANGVVEVRVDDRTKTYNHGEQKGYLVAGDTIQVEYTGIQFYRPKTVTLHWLNVAHVEIARTEVHFSDGIDNLVKNVGDKPLAQTFQDQWTVFDPDNKVHNATYSENTLNVRWEKRDTTNQIWYGIQLYYVKSGLKQGDKVTVKFTVTAQQNCTLQFFENTDFATEIKLTKDVPYSFESKVVTLDGNLYSILLFLCPIDSKVGTDGRVEDGSISISNLEVEKFEYRFTDANLEEQDGNVYFVLQGAYTGFDSVMLTELKEYLCDFEYNDGFNDGNSNDTPVSKDRIYPCNKEDWVSYEVSNGVFKYKIKINELIAYCYYFHFGWKNPNGDFKDLASHSDIHGRTLVYGGHVYTLYNFGLGQSGPEHFYELLGLTVRENKLANWDANKGLTNNYTLNQGEKVVLSATIEDATNWGIVALLKLNGQDGILIAPDKVSSYIEKKTADVSGSVRIGETNYTVTPTPGENLDNAKASGAIVTIMIEYIDSAISVTYTIQNAEQANYTFSVTIDGVSGGSCVVGFAQSGGTNASLSVSTR